MRESAPRPRRRLPLLLGTAVDFPATDSRLESSMAFAGTGIIWMDGKMVDWKDATIHVASHVIHYGTGAFEGLRAYNTKSGTAVFRLEPHMRRMIDSCRVYRMEPAWSQSELEK